MSEKKEVKEVGFEERLRLSCFEVAGRFATSPDIDDTIKKAMKLFEWVSTGGFRFSKESNDVTTDAMNSSFPSNNGNGKDIQLASEKHNDVN